MKKMRFPILIWLIVFALFMAGCGAVASGTATPVEKVTNSTQTPTPTSTAASTPTPTSTPASVSTPTPAQVSPNTETASGASSLLGRRPGGTETELLYWDKTNAYNGYTLFAAAGRSYLIDMEGNVVNTWSIGNNPQLLSNGNFLDAAQDDPNSNKGWKELDWDGNVVWEYYETREGYAPHHDWVKIYNPKLKEDTFMYIANKTVTEEEAIAAGCDPEDGPYEGAQMDAVVEVDREGNIIWEWRFIDHVIQDIDPTKANYVGEGKTIADFPGRLNINLPGRPLRKDWLHCNSMDYNQELDQIVINSVQGEFYVIDHGNTFTPSDPEGSIALAAGSGGDFLYRFGDPARYDQGDPPSILEDWTASTAGNKQIGGSHNIQWIDSGLPGEGNFLVFNNGQYLFERTLQSYIFEIDGFLDAEKIDTGNYVNPPDAGYWEWTSEDDRNTHKQLKLMSNQIVWTYSSKNNTAFFSHIGSSAQRLPNGNTLICADTEGHFFEVTNEGVLVWDYINPITKDYGILDVVPDSLPMTNQVFRAYRYGPDHPAFVGKDMTAKGAISSFYEAPPISSPTMIPSHGNTEMSPAAISPTNTMNPREAPETLDVSKIGPLVFIRGDLVTSEGPVWDQTRSVLLFSDIAAIRTYHSGNRHLFDVHGADCWRNDPKSVDPADYPYALGRHGDVIPIENQKGKVANEAR